MTPAKPLRILLHILAWAAFIYLTAPLLTRFEHPAAPLLPALFAVGYLFLIIYFYLNLNAFVPLFLSKKKIIVFLVITCAAYALFCFLIPYLFHPYLSPQWALLPQRPDPALTSPRLAPRIFGPSGLYSRSSQFLVVFIISTGWKAGTQWYAEKQRLQELENSIVQAELSFLKSQIHPHFLFNSLNSIYYLALTQDPKAPEAILSLSGFLRFVTTESNHNRIPLEKEVKMLEEYIHLQSLRTTEKFELRVNLDGDFRFRTIMPLTFVPFVENAFKHGISAHVHCYIYIDMKIDHDRLHFSCTNSIVPGITDKNLSSGIGLENIRKRLALAYPDRHTLSLSPNSQSFHVELQIHLT
jgi:hypothetical protein